MAESYRCPQCGAEVPGDAPQGLCPNCVLKAGFGTQQTDSVLSVGSESASASSFDAQYVPPAPAELAPHFPDLEILELVGRGGMGVVYKARQKRLDRLVALKILAPKIGQDPAFAERFAREARAMAMLSHPHVVAVHDFGQTDGLYYFLMEFVDGVNLRRLLDTGKLTPEEALAIVPQICEALQYAHDHGVVHRDIKPENLLLDKEGRVKIADFGIAKLVGKETKDLALTGAGQIVGTLQYMAPEQIEHPLQVDHRADIYSLGVVFYQMLTGELPIGRFAPPSKKVQIDVRLDEVVLRALEKEPERRYQQASEIKTQVESIVTTPDASGAATGEVPTSGTPLKQSMCYVSTPEHLRSFQGRFLRIYKGKGELRLDNESLSFNSDWPTVMIPLSSIRRIARGDYPISAKPMPLHFIEVTFTENNVERTLLFNPVLREVMFPHEANKVTTEWIAALLEAVRSATGRTLSVEQSQMGQDKFGFAKMVLLTTVQLTVICSMIPAILLHQVPSLFSVLLVALIGMISTMTTFLVMRWWHRRSVIASGSLDSLTMRVAGTGGLTVEATSDKPTWQSPNSGWGWLVGKIFGITFTSRTAYRCANLSALGFLGFLGFIPGSGWQGCFGFFGIFGLIGVAHVFEALARPNLTAGKWLVMVTALGMAIAVFITFLFAYFGVMPSRPQQQWQTTTKLSGPGIDRVLTEGRRATIEGEASTDSRIMFALAGGFESCGFKKNGRFTATVKTAFWRNGLDITVVDADGNQLLTAWVNGLGSAQFPPYHIEFGNAPLKPVADGRITIGYAVKDNGARMPLTVQLSGPAPATPVHGNVASAGREPAGQAKQPTEPVLQFSPVVERAVNAVSEGKGGDGLDLAGDKLVEVPKEFSTWSAQQQNKWSTGNDVDLVVALVTGTFVGAPDNRSLALVPEGLKLAAIWDGRWQSARDEDLRSALNSPDPTQAVSPEGMVSVGVTVSERHGISYYLPFNSGPLTFAFQTRNGHLGLLQVIRFTEEPRGIRLRYKMVKSSVSPNGAQSSTPAVDPGAEFRALQGPWLVTRVQKGSNADFALSGPGGSFDVSAVNRIDFSDRYVELEVIGKGHTATLEYRFNPEATPKIIGIHEQSVEGRLGELVASGVYEIDGDRLKLCLTKHRPAMMTQQSPRSFTAEPQSANVLLTLERLRLSDDDKSLAATWTLVKKVVDGKEGSADEMRGQSFLFFGSLAIRNGAGGMNSMQYQCVLDPKKQPKTMTLIGWKPLPSSFENEREELLGIYEFEGDRLTIAYRTNGPRPEEFESKPDSGVTLLVLQKSKPSGKAEPSNSTTGTEAERPEAPDKPASDAAVGARTDSQKSGEQAPFEFSVIIAQHVMLLDGKQIVTWPQIEEMIAKRPNPSQTRPKFLFTLGAVETDRYQAAKKEIWRLHRDYKLVGHVEGSLSPQDNYRYDRIRTADDLKAIEPPATPGMTSLKEAVGVFNYRAERDAVGKTQPPLTEDEVIAALRWALLEPHKLPISDKTIEALREIVKSRELPAGYELEVISDFQPNNQMEVTRWSVRLRIPSTAGPGHTTCVSIREQPIRSRLIGEEERKVIEKWQKKWQTEGMPLGDLRRGGEYEKERAKAAEIDRSKRDDRNGRDSDSGDGTMKPQRDHRPSTSVFLGGYQVTDMDVKHLEGIDKIQSLNLANASVTDDGLKHLKGAAELRSLDLTFTKITDAGLKNLQDLTNLQSLNLHGLGITNAGLEHLKALTTLRDLNLYNTQITDAGLGYLKGLSKLRSLDLWADNVTDAGLAHLKGLPQLESLNLGWTKVTDAGLENLKELSQLRTLNLAKTKVTDAGLEHLIGLTKLESLDLTETRVTDDGKKQLRQSLPHCVVQP